MQTFPQFQQLLSFIPAIFLVLGVSGNTGINTTSKEIANSLLIKGEHSTKNCTFTFEIEFGKIQIASPDGVQRSITMQPEPKPVGSTDSELSYWYSEPFELFTTDTVKADMHILGSYYNTSTLPKSSDILNGDEFLVYVNLIEDNPLRKSSETQQDHVLSTREEYVVKFHNAQPIAFNQTKPIVIDNSKMRQGLSSKKIRLRLGVYSSKIHTSDLKIQNVNPFHTDNKVDEDLQ